MNTKITSFIGSYFNSILVGKIIKSDRRLSKSFLQFLLDGIIKVDWYFCFKMYQNQFQDDALKSLNLNDAMYSEYLINKTYISDFFDKKPSLRTMVVLGKTIVDAFAMQVQELYPDSEVVIFCMINKQRSSDVWISIYEYKDWCNPILEPYADKYTNNSYYLKRIHKSII